MKIVVDGIEVETERPTNNDQEKHFMDEYKKAFSPIFILIGIFLLVIIAIIIGYFFGID